jgi:hypothetical protein
LKPKTEELWDFGDPAQDAHGCALPLESSGALQESAEAEKIEH